MHRHGTLTASASCRSRGLENGHDPHLPPTPRSAQSRPPIHKAIPEHHPLSDHSPTTSPASASRHKRPVSSSPTHKVSFVVITPRLHLVFRGLSRPYCSLSSGLLNHVVAGSYYLYFLDPRLGFDPSNICYQPSCLYVHASF